MFRLFGEVFSLVEQGLVLTPSALRGWSEGLGLLLLEQP